MALYDHERRMAQDYIHDSPARYDEAGAGVSWVGILIGLAVIAFITFVFLATPSQDPMGGKTVSPAETAPTTTAVPQSPTPSPTAPTTQPK